MSHQQFHAEVQQWAELEEEAPAPSEEQDEHDFVKHLEEKFPILRAWPVKESK